MDKSVEYIPYKHSVIHMLFPRWFNKLVLLLGGLLIPFVVQGAGFSDVPYFHKHHTAISQLSDAGVINGYSDGSFRPENLVTRAEAAKLLITGTKSPEFVSSVVADYYRYQERFASFYDVDLTQWYAPYVSLANQYQFATGYADGSFKPGNSINFAEGLKMILGAYGVDVSSTRYISKPLLLVQPHDWFAPYFEYAHQKNLINRDKFYHPGQLMTRGEFSEILYRIKIIKEERLDNYRVVGSNYSNEYTLTIPKLNLINVNVGFADPYDSNGALAVLSGGLGHYLSPPGTGKKMVLFGHSSGYNWDTSSFKQILRQIDQLNVGDIIYINYQEKGYAYRINREEIMPAGDLVKVMSDSSGEELVMYTCWPPDQISHRYVVYATPI